MNDQGEITRQLIDARKGSREAFDEVFRHVYDTLRSVARQQLQHQRHGGTLNTTVLVHEAYERLIGNTHIEWQDRSHFFAIAARAMRFVLTDYARARTAQKRGGQEENVSIDSVQVAAEQRADDLVMLDDALEKLSKVNERLAKLVELRFFGGLTYEEIAEMTGLSVRTVKRDWQRARTWLYYAMKSEEEGTGQ